MRYKARSASDKTDDWPFWFVEEGGLNTMKSGRFYGGKFDTREVCEELADQLNQTPATKAG